MQPLKQKELHLQAFLLALGVAAAFFIPFIIKDQGFFLFYGDFNVQQVPFYKLAHEMVRSGNIFWNWNTDLGVNFIGSYSFYLLGSPFFWLTLPFPTEIVPYLMGPLLILKFACASFTAYLYIRRFVRKPTTALIASLLYAFSGFSVYNIFFNHFHEAIILFPLLLYALELYMAENRKGVFAFVIFLSALSNYFFFAGMAVFIFIYWVLRIASGAWNMTLPRFFWLAFEVLVGIGIAAVLLMPSYFSVMQNPRTSYANYGWNAILYTKPQLFANIIEVFFFPPDLPARPVFFPGTEERWASLGAWMPLFGMTGVCAYLVSKKGTWLRRIIILLTFMALVPVLNSSFILFNSSYYARWFYMPILMMALATAVSIEDKEAKWKTGWKWNLAIVLGFFIAIGFYPAQSGATENMKSVSFPSWEWYDKFKENFGLYDKEFHDRFWITCGIAIVSLIIMAVLIPLIKKAPKSFAQFSLIAVLCVSVIYSTYYIGMGKTHGYDTTGHIIPDLIKGNIDLEDTEEFRVDVYEGMDNTGMFLGLPTIQAFHSIVPVSIMDFYNYVGVERAVGSRPEPSHYGLRSLLSVKYLLDYSKDGNYFIEEDEPKINGFKFYKHQNNYDIYENENYIPYGFTYDYYINTKACEEHGEAMRELMMLKAILLNDKQIKKYKGLLKPYDEVTDPSYYKEYTDGSYGYGVDIPDNIAVPMEANFTYEDFAADAAARKKESSYFFERDNKGFTSKIKLSKENLVFFSVPYEENGWTATVNGVKTEIEKVNKGFMAVKVPAGDATIRFDYSTPGLNTGIIISITSVLLFILYILGWKIFKKHRTEEFDRTPPPVGGENFAEITGELQIEDLDALNLALENISVMNANEEDSMFTKGYSLGENTEPLSDLPEPETDPENRNDVS